MIAQIQSRPEPEAREIYRHMRTKTHAGDLGAFIREITDTMSEGALRQQPQQGQSYHYQQFERDRKNSQHQYQLHLRSQQHHLPQQQRPNTFFQPDYAVTGSTVRLPPLRSMVQVPIANINATQQLQSSQPLSLLAQRNMSEVSAVSSDSHTNLSSSTGRSGQSLFPRMNKLLG
jgi:hypothetical protein